MVVENTVAPTSANGKKRAGSLRRFLSLGSSRNRRVETAFLSTSSPTEPESPNANSVVQSEPNANNEKIYEKVEYVPVPSPRRGVSPVRSLKKEPIYGSTKKPDDAPIYGSTRRPTEPIYGSTRQSVTVTPVRRNEPSPVHRRDAASPKRDDGLYGAGRRPEPIYGSTRRIDVTSRPTTPSEPIYSRAGGRSPGGQSSGSNSPLPPHNRPGAISPSIRLEPRIASSIPVKASGSQSPLGVPLDLTRDRAYSPMLHPGSPHRRQVTPSPTYGRSLTPNNLRSGCTSPTVPKTSFTPDTSLVLEERKEQLKRHDWKESGVGLPPSGRKLHHPDEEWSGDGGKSGRNSNSTSEQGGRLDEEGRGEGGGSGSGSGGGSGRSRGARSREDALRRHTLGAPDRYAGLRAMDLEMGTKSNRRKSPQPRGYPPPNMLLDDDPGIMSEVETSSTGFRRGNKQRSSLPVVRTPSKTLERPLGLVFLQYRSETKRALLPNEITSIDTVKALFVRSFPKQLTMEYMESPHVKIYIHDSSKDMFYELEDLRSHLRDIRDRSVLRLFESDDVVGGGLGISMGITPGTIPTWDQDQSYFSEPEFDSDYQHQHIHKTKGSKSSVGGHSGPPYYMTHSFPPGGGGGTLPRGASAGSTSSLLRGYSSSNKPSQSSVDGYMSSPERSSVAPRGYPGPGYSNSGSYDDPYYAGYPPRAGAITPVIDEEASDTEGMDDTYVTSAAPGYKMRPAAATFPPPVVPPMDQTRLRVEHMERQLASLTGLVQKALTQQVIPGCSTPQPVAPPPHIYHRSASDKSVSFEKSVSFSDEPPDMNSPKQHSPQHSDRDRHKPTPPPKPVSLSPGQYESRNVYRDLQLTAEMYNHLRGLQKKAKDLRQEVRNLRRMSQTQAHTVRETLRDAFLKIRSVLVSAGGEGLWSPGGDELRTRVNREGDLYRQQMIRLESDLTELEGTVEELRGNVINRKTRVNMSDVEAMALILSKSSKMVAELKLRFPSLQDAIKSLIAQEMDKVVSEEKFLKEEPERLESALRRCKKLTGTLVTLKRLASVQEQRLPDARLSPPPDETPPVTPTSGKEPGGGEGAAEQLGGAGGGGGSCRSENPLDALLDELQSLGGSNSGNGGNSGGGNSGGGTLRRLHSYPSDSGGGRLPPAPPPRTSSKSPGTEDKPAVPPDPASRQAALEAKHQELLRKQRALQEQYTRLQSLSRPAPPPDLLQLKKTGSESNLLGKIGLTPSLALAPTGSLSQLSTAAASSASAAQPTSTKIYETDIL